MIILDWSGWIASCLYQCFKNVHNHKLKKKFLHLSSYRYTVNFLLTLKLNTCPFSIHGLWYAELWTTTSYLDPFHLLLVLFKSSRGLMLPTTPYQGLYPSQPPVQTVWVLTPGLSLSTSKTFPPPLSALSLVGLLLTIYYPTVAMYPIFWVLLE